MTNAEISAVFDDIAEMLKLKEDNIFKIRAYQKVARAITELAVPVEQMASENRLSEIPGAGEAITKKITELVATGRLAFYEKLKAEFPEHPALLKNRGQMTQGQDNLVPTDAAAAGDAEAISHFRQAVASGKNWYLALLESIGLWSSASEEYNGRDYRYLIDSEAFDWLLLAERLCETVDGQLPEEETSALLFQGIPPIALNAAEVKQLIGDKKYAQYLNYFYGVTVEEALVLAVQEEIDKETTVQGMGHKSALSDEPFLRIYDSPREALMQQFREDKGYAQLKSTSLTELKEFTYWLFKYRLKRCEKAKIASDTKKALTYLKRHWQRKGVNRLLASDLNPSFPA